VPMQPLFAPIGTQRAQRVFAAAFVLMLSLPLVGQLAGWDNQVRLLERREPAPFPSLPRTRDALQAWPQQFDRYVVDRAGFRSALVFAGSYLDAKLFRHSANDDVVFGDDGWLFYAGNRTLEQMRGTDLFAPAALDRWIDFMEQQRDWLAARHVPLLIVVVPNKERVYHEHLPASAGALAPVTRLAQIRHRLAERGSTLHLLDLTDALVAAKDDGQIYARRDTHWSGLGAFVGYLEIMRRLQPLLPQLDPLRAEQMDNVAITYPAHDLDLMRMLGLGLAGEGETLDYPLLHGTPGWTTAREDSVVDGRRRMRLTSTRAHAPSAVWFHDSFSDSLAVYLNSTFSTVTLEEQAGFRFDHALIEAAKPDVVVYEFVERFLTIEAPND
jgi:alginate O-acetyltransferase complex protein AlgJ